MKVATFFYGRVPLGKEIELAKAYSETVDEGLPDGLEKTFLMKNLDDQNAYTIFSLWRDREALEAMRSKGRPKAIELFEKFGSQPRVSIFYIEVEHP